LTFVALDKQGKPTVVPPVIPETEEEKRRYREAGERREYRLARRNRDNNQTKS
jgi:acyl-CoA hydrolase